MNFNVFGIGVDIVENERIKKILESPIRAKFLNRMFSKAEIELASGKFENLENSLKSQNITNFFAKRFAGKEAFVKALGFDGLFSFADISILNDEFGCPYLRIDDESKALKIKDFLERKLGEPIKKQRFLISLSDEKLFSISYVQILVYL